MLIPSCLLLPCLTCSSLLRVCLEGLLAAVLEIHLTFVCLPNNVIHLHDEDITQIPHPTQKSEAALRGYTTNLGSVPSDKLCYARRLDSNNF